MAAVESKASQTIAKRLKEVEPGTPRHDVLEVARRFKTSWMELGAKLWEVRQKKMFRDWGYDKFETYCQEEICIKPRTAAKLTASYSFLKKEEPSVLRRDGIQQPVPEMQAVEVLRKARKIDGLPEKEYSKIKEMAFRDAPASDLRRELKQHKPAPEPTPPERILRQILLQANRLADSLASVQGIPHVIVERALALVDDIRALIKS